jgi:hypothetical protein
MNVFAKSLKKIVQYFMALRVLSHKYNPHRRVLETNGAAPGWGCSFFEFLTIIFNSIYEKNMEK